MKTTTIENDHLNWKLSFGEGGLSPSAQIDKMAQDSNLFRPPTIVFGNNHCVIKDTSSGLTIRYDAPHALNFLNFQHRADNFQPKQPEKQANSICYIPEKYQVIHADKWKNIDKPKGVQISQIVETSDSFFITPFRGHIEGTQVKVEPTEENVIPIHKLGPQNIIKFYQQGTIYEDQLDDNGLIQFEYKFRTMENSWFALIRCYARIDHVAVLVLDTRLYWEQGWKKVARQFMVKKAPYEVIKQKEGELPPGWTTNPNQSHLLYPHLKEELTRNEYLHF